MRACRPTGHRRPSAGGEGKAPPPPPFEASRTGGAAVGVELPQEAEEVASLLDLRELQRELLCLHPDPRLWEGEGAEEGEGARTATPTVDEGGD